MRFRLPLETAALLAVVACQDAPPPTPDVPPPGAVPATAARTNACPDDSTWTAPQAPFRIYGNTWHVGPRGLGVFLITSPAGHVLIDGGVPGGAALIEANIARAGFNVRDVKWILISHAHCDHAGDVAQLASSTGAQVIAGADANTRAIASFVRKTDWIDFLAVKPKTRSNTSVCLKFTHPKVAALDADKQAAFAKGIVATLEKEGAGLDLGHYRDAPPGLRIWCGATVQTRDIKALIPWIEYAFAKQLATLG